MPRCTILDAASAPNCGLGASQGDMALSHNPAQTIPDLDATRGSFWRELWLDLADGKDRVWILFSCLLAVYLPAC